MLSALGQTARTAPTAAAIVRVLPAHTQRAADMVDRLVQIVRGTTRSELPYIAERALRPIQARIAARIAGRVYPTVLESDVRQIYAIAKRQ